MQVTFHNEGEDLRYLINNDLSYNNEIILWNFDQEMGIDMAFLALNDGNVRLVAMQSKSGNQSGLSKAILTLSPGLQYLSNNQRLYLITGNKDEKAVKCSRSPKRTNYENFMLDHPQLSDNWIRVSLTNSKPDYEYEKNLFSDELDKKDYLKSRLYMLTCQSTDFLNYSLRLKLLSSTKPTKEDKLKEKQYYFSISIENSITKLENLLSNNITTTNAIPMKATSTMTSDSTSTSTILVPSMHESQAEINQINEKAKNILTPEKLKGDKTISSSSSPTTTTQINNTNAACCSIS